MTFIVNEDNTLTIVNTELESNNEYLAQWLEDQDLQAELDLVFE